MKKWLFRLFFALAVVVGIIFMPMGKAQTIQAKTAAMKKLNIKFDLKKGKWVTIQTNYIGDVLLKRRVKMKSYKIQSAKKAGYRKVSCEIFVEHENPSKAQLDKIAAAHKKANDQQPGDYVFPTGYATAAWACDYNTGYNIENCDEEDVLASKVKINKSKWVNGKKHYYKTSSGEKWFFSDTTLKLTATYPDEYSGLSIGISGNHDYYMLDVPSLEEFPNNKNNMHFFRVTGNTPTADKSLSITSGDKKTVSIKGKGTKIKSKPFKSYNTDIAEVSKDGVVTAKKSGQCKIKITVKYKDSKNSKDVFTKVFKIEVKVKKAPKSEEDKAILTKIIEEQNALGADIPTNFDDEDCYIWGSNGHIEEIYWGESGLSGNISLSGLSGLKVFFCSENKLVSLDLRDCSKLEYLDCSENEITSLDLSACTKLYKLYCSYNKLVELDMSSNTKLEYLYCDEGIILTGVPKDCYCEAL